MKKRKIKDNNSHYARYVLEEVMIAIVIMLVLLFFFVWVEKNPFSGQAIGGADYDEQFAHYVTQCSQGIPQACEKISEAAENVQIESVETDYERELLREQRMVR
ncbi:MAG TPA: hypothetical protein VJB66_03205 [Candidatus Nanoarchaeia archaeon]|nr:hypothetical protein [Candidatus Nanoarchaeia archaeon]